MKIRFLLSLLVAFVFSTIAFAQKKTNNYYLLIGTYTKRTSDGIYVYKFDTKTGDATPVSVAKDIKNPSFLTYSPDQKFVYSVGEIDGNGAVNSFSFDKKTGNLSYLNTQSAGGANPCYVTTDKTGKWVLVGNYTGGSLSILPTNNDGSLNPATQTIQHEGKSVDVDRQEKAHVHSVNIAPNNVDVFVPDLGQDKIVVYSLDSKNGKLSEGSPKAVETAAGAGPRHFSFHPNGKYGYVIQELNGTITAYTYGHGTLKPFQTISTLPKNFTGKNSCADIHISADGRFLYGTNRFFDQIVSYSINPKNGKLTYIENVSVQGKIPRNFAIDPSGKFVLIANQESDNITVFNRNPKTGKLTYTGKEIKVSMPVCLKFMPIE